MTFLSRTNECAPCGDGDRESGPAQRPNTIIGISIGRKMCSVHAMLLVLVDGKLPERRTSRDKHEKESERR